MKVEKSAHIGLIIIFGAFLGPFTVMWWIGKSHAAFCGNRRRAMALSNWQAFLHRDRMTKLISYRGYRYPPEVISYAVWPYYRFTLSFRAIEDLLDERGVMVSSTKYRHTVSIRKPLGKIYT